MNITFSGKPLGYFVSEADRVFTYFEDAFVARSGRCVLSKTDVALLIAIVAMFHAKSLTSSPVSLKDCAIHLTNLQISQDLERAIKLLEDLRVQSCLKFIRYLAQAHD